MPKSTLKLHLQSLTKEQTIDLVLQIYDNVKPAKEFMEFYLNPNEKEILEKYHKIIIQKFYPDTKSFNPKIQFSVCKKAISDFRALKKPSPELLADLMITLPETACKFTYEFEDMWEQYYDSTIKNIEATYSIN